MGRRATGVDVRTGSQVFSQGVPPAGSTTQFGLPRGAVVSRDGHYLYVASDFSGVVGVDVRSGREIGFTRLLNLDHRLRVLDGRGVHPSGSLFIPAARPGGAPHVYFLGPDLIAMDSISLTGLPTRDAILSPDESLVYVQARPRLVAIDVASKQIIYETSTQQYGLLSISPSGDRVFLAESGTRDAGASGILEEYSRDLSTRRNIALSVPGLVEAPPSAWSVAASRDGARAWVVTGYPFGSLAGPQTVDVREIDLQSGVVTRVINLNDPGLGPRMHLLEPPS